MSIVLDLQKEATNSNIDILSLLRKAYWVARKLKLIEFQKWIDNELSGYKVNAEIPEYRRIRGELKYCNQYNGGWSTIKMPNNEMEKKLCEHCVSDSIPSLNDLLLKNDNDLTIGICANRTAELNQILGLNTKYCLYISPNLLSDIIEQVKNYILKWALVLEENDILDDGINFTDVEILKAQNETKITSYTINIYGNVSDSQIQQSSKASTQNIKK